MTSSTRLARLLLLYSGSFPDNHLANVAKRSIPDPNTVSGIVVQINTILSTTVTKVNAVVKVNLSGVDLTTLGVAIYTLFAVSVLWNWTSRLLNNVWFIQLILSVLDTLVKIVLLLGPGAAGPLRGPIVALLYGFFFCSRLLIY